ncbi:MAG: nucleoside triphosphate pyrophosphohydrolase [Clostridia bacterium]|nr:nucleoside triphosphate pyrophosphohydrolase [Clostridia bacterium]
MKITLIGLGTDRYGLTKGGEKALKEADKIIARTANTRSFGAMEGYEVQTLDKLFESCRNFDTLNKKLAKAVTDAAKEYSVCYCVDGAVCEDEACRIILAKHRDCEVFEGASKSAHAANLARLKSPQYTAVSAYDIQNLKSCAAAVVYDIDGYFIATQVKLVLSNLFGEEADCTFIHGDEAEKIKVYEIDRKKEYDYSCAVAVEEGEFLKKERYDYADLEKMIKLLRAPDGCPWDRAQTNESIKSNVIEEAYELADAIERGDDYDMEEETGDVLLQAAFHAVMKEEQGAFNGADAITRLIKKLIFRHSHIFGSDKAKDDTEALGVWEKNKREEKSQKSYSDTVIAVPKNMPACMRAQKVGKRSSKCGMDFLSPVSASEKLAEEITELIDACVAEDKEAIFDEAGDVLYSAVNVCRLAGVDCEEALHAAVDKFINRFTVFEKLATADGEKIEDMDPSRWDYYWALAKNELKKH